MRSWVAAALAGTGAVALAAVALVVPHLRSGAPPEPEAPAVAAHPSVVAGTVLEATSAGGHSYLRMSTAEGEMWAIVPVCEVRPGERVKVTDVIRIADFVCPALGRTLPLAVIGALDPR